MRVAPASSAALASAPWAMSLCAMRSLLAATGLSASSRARDASSTAWASCFMTLGKWSRYRPVADSTTSTRARPSRSRSTSFTPVTRPPWSHTGSTPSSHRAWASSMPKWRMVSTDQRLKVSFFGCLPCSLRCSASMFSAACLPASQACLVGMREGSKP